MSTSTIAFGLAHALAGLTLTAGTFKLVEQHRQRAVLFVVGSVLVILLVDLVVLITVSWPNTGVAILSGILGSLVGTGSIVLIFEPEIEDETDITAPQSSNHES